LAVREQNLDTVGATYASFNVKQTAGVDDLNDTHIGKAVTVTANYEVGPATANSIVIGKLIDLTLTDADHGARVATVQIGGVMTLPIAATYPVIGNKVVGGGSGAIKQAPVLAGYDPAGGNIARGTVIAVNGTTDCVIIL
jgi:hypothetical protein